MPEHDSPVAVVTGAASGIGAAAARTLAQRGMSVMVADIDEERGRRVAEEIGPRATFVEVDVRCEADIATAIDTALDRFHRLDCLVNNAGVVGRWKFLYDTPSEEWDDAFAVLARSVFLGIKHAAPVMCRQRSGSIINISSVAGVRTGFGPHPYSAAKAAVLQLTRTAASELAPHHVRVNAIVPGGIATRIVGHGAGLEGSELDNSVESVRDSLRGFQPIPRAGEPVDLAHAIAFLASDQSSFITGETLGVDGGLTLGRRWPTNFVEDAQASASRRGTT